MPKDSDNEREPNSQRHWRINSIMALKETRECEREAVDPEHLEIIKAKNTELAQLEARENAVKTRHAAIVEQRRKNAKNNDKSL